MSDELKRTRAAIFAKCRDRGIDADTRHALQRRVTGKESLTDMTLQEMRAVYAALAGRETVRTGGRRAGKTYAQAGKYLPAGPHTSKLRALWISAYWLGVVRDREDKALASWICRQTGLDAARWATPAHTAQAIEALKDWMARDGGVDWRPYAHKKHNPGARILEALWRKLHAAGAVRIADHGALHSWVVGFRRAQDSYSTLNGWTLNQLIRELGTWLRKEANYDC